jgi:hypothetical protein
MSDRAGGFPLAIVKEPSVMTAQNILRQLFLWTIFKLVDPGNTGVIDANKDFGVLELSFNGTETRFLPAPLKSGLDCTLTVGTPTSGSAKVAIGATSGTPSTTIDGLNKFATLSAYGQMVKLTSIPASATAFKWSLVVSQGASLSAT